MTSRLNPSSLSRLLSRANAAESFNYNVSNRLKKLRTVDEGLPRTEDLMIRSFKIWHRRDSEKSEFKSGDSSVLVPLVELSEDQQPWVIFTHRSYKLRKHRGEISFPGGGIDQGESIEEAAMREAEEEIFMHKDANSIQIWGRLPAMLTRHNTNIITPIVGVVNEEALKRIKIQTDEVQSVFMAPLGELTNPQYTAFRVGTSLYQMPVFHTKNYRLLAKDESAFDLPNRKHRIWGLTGGILNELLCALLSDEHYKYIR